MPSGACTYTLCRVIKSCFDWNSKISVICLATLVALHFTPLTQSLKLSLKLALLRGLWACFSDNSGHFLNDLIFSATIWSLLSKKEATLIKGIHLFWSHALSSLFSKQCLPPTCTGVFCRRWQRWWNLIRITTSSKIPQNIDTLQHYHSWQWTSVKSHQDSVGMFGVIRTYTVCISTTWSYRV